MSINAQRRFWKIAVHGVVITNVISSLAIYAYAQDMLPEIVDQTVTKAEQHGFLLVFACVALVGMIIVFYFAGRLAVASYRDVAARCSAMEAELIEVKGADRAKLVLAIERSTQTSEDLGNLVSGSREDHQKIVSVLEAINERLEGQPCGMTTEELESHVDRVRRRQQARS